MIASILLVAAAYIIEKYWITIPKRLQRPSVPPMPQAKKARRDRTVWCREWLTRRSIHGDYDQLLKELHREDPKGYKNFVRIEPGLFAEMVERISPRLTKKETRMRKPLPVGLKLAVTLC